ncbi:MAG: biopolymer transport protein ExbB [Crocinitomicaceae bacterium]|jgi:biopolymer transport protein ExbB
MIKLIIASLLLSTAVFSYSEDKAVDAQPDNIQYLSDLLGNIKAQGEKNALTQKQREILFKQDYSAVKNQLSFAVSELSEVKLKTKSLTNSFEGNEEDLAELDEELKKSLGNLGEMFGVVRQVAQDVSSIREGSLLKVELGDSSEVLNKLSESKALPSIAELEGLWFEIQNQMTKQGEIKRINSVYVDIDGVKNEGEIAHIGPFVAFNQNGYLNYDTETGLFLELGKQPSSASSAIDFFNGSSDVFSEIYIDPTRGTLLSLSSQSPSYIDRIHQGGFIGYVIIVLASLGIGFGLYLLVIKLMVAKQVNNQLKNLDSPKDDNPLGRVLAVYNAERELDDLETLEMKLDEAVLKELPEIEKGQSLIKLLAAVAPLLGLLGTVTGMIATFQSITLFGTGDPKLMAGGISQALITTVLGLVAAIPLLFVHNIISTRSKALIQILTQQSAGMIAEQAQKGPN